MYREAPFDPAYVSTVTSPFRVDDDRLQIGGRTVGRWRRLDLEEIAWLRSPADETCPWVGDVSGGIGWTTDDEHRAAAELIVRAARGTVGRTADRARRPSVVLLEAPRKKLDHTNLPLLSRDPEYLAYVRASLVLPGKIVAFWALDLSVVDWLISSGPARGPGRRSA